METIAKSSAMPPALTQVQKPNSNENSEEPYGGSLVAEAGLVATALRRADGGIGNTLRVLIL
jgi:hypothetical protein